MFVAQSDRRFHRRHSNIVTFADSVAVAIIEQGRLGKMVITAMASVTRPVVDL